MSRRPRKQRDGLTFNEFRRGLKAGEVESLYLFLGEEGYFHERALRLLYETVEEAGRLLNVSVFSIDAPKGGVRTTAAAVVDTANQLPMMAGRRVIVVRDFEKITQPEIELILEYLKRPSPTTSVIFQTRSLDERRKLATALLKTCTVVRFDRLNDKQAASWAQGYLKLRGCAIDPDALGHLIGLVGSRIERLANDLDKLVTYAGGGSINKTMIEELIPRSREHTSWELWDALLAGDRKQALKLTSRLLDDGLEPVMIVGALAALYRRMLIAKDLMARDASSEEVARATGQYGFRARPFNSRVNRTPREEIVHGLRRLAQVDNAIKNSEATPRLQIEYLVAELTLPESAAWGIVR